MRWYWRTGSIAKVAMRYPITPKKRLGISEFSTEASSSLPLDASVGEGSRPLLKTQKWQAVLAPSMLLADCTPDSGTPSSGCPADHAGSLPTDSHARPTTTPS